jgi:hypothetical protein
MSFKGLPNQRGELSDYRSNKGEGQPEINGELGVRHLTSRKTVSVFEYVNFFREDKWS